MLQSVKVLIDTIDIREICTFLDLFCILRNNRDRILQLLYKFLNNWRNKIKMLIFIKY